MSISCSKMMTNISLIKVCAKKNFTNEIKANVVDSSMHSVRLLLMGKVLTAANVSWELFGFRVLGRLDILWESKCIK